MDGQEVNLKIQISQDQIDTYVHNYIKDRLRSMLTYDVLLMLVKDAIANQVHQHLDKLNVEDQVKLLEREGLQNKICESVATKVISMIASGFNAETED